MKEGSRAILEILEWQDERFARNHWKFSVLGWSRPATKWRVSRNREKEPSEQHCLIEQANVPHCRGVSSTALLVFTQQMSNGTTKNVSRHCQLFLGGQNRLFENHWAKQGLMRDWLRVATRRKEENYQTTEVPNPTNVRIRPTWIPRQFACFK